MTTHTPARVSAGIPAGGQLAAATCAERALSLRAPAADSFVSATLESAGDTRTTSSDLLAAITDRLNESRNFSDENVLATHDVVWRENYGYTSYEQDSFETAINGLRGNDPAAAVAVLRYAKAVAGDQKPDGTFDVPQPVLSQPDSITTPVLVNDRGAGATSGRQLSVVGP